MCSLLADLISATLMTAALSTLIFNPFLFQIDSENFLPQHRQLVLLTLFIPSTSRHKLIFKQPIGRKMLHVVCGAASPNQVRDCSLRTSRQLPDRERKWCVARETPHSHIFLGERLAGPRLERRIGNWLRSEV